MSEPKTKNIQWHEGEIGRRDRERLLGQRGSVVWMTGLSGSGKSTIAYEVERRLVSSGHLAYVLDGDNVRHGLNRGLGFSAEDRAENMRRVAEVARLIADTGTIVLISLISPSRDERAKAREIIGEKRFYEVWVATPLEVCEARDPKGLYAKARAGKIAEFTGISAPYEEPENADLVLETEEEDVGESAGKTVEMLQSRGVFEIEN